MPLTFSSAPPSAAGLAPGELLDQRYCIEALHAAGGWGEVYRAEDLDAAGERRRVAIKLLRPLGEEQQRRVQREVLALRLARSPGVVELLGQGRVRGRLYLALGWVEGEPLPQLGWTELQPVAQALLSTLAHLHDLGMVHRDLKPANILLREDGSPVLVDFGLAAGEELGDALTRVGEPVGTALYAAPEQLRGEPVDGRGDLYALGVTLYESLTGKLPFLADTREQLLSARLHRYPTPVEQLVALPAEASALIGRLLRPLPAERPTAREALRLLGAVVPPEREPLPWLGGEERLRPALEAAAAGAGVWVLGEGRGRTRLLEEVGARRPEARWLEAGEAPFASLAPLLGAPGPGQSWAEVQSAARDAVDGAPLLLADPWERLDPWTQALLLERAPGGGLLATAQAPPQPGVKVLELPPLTEDALRALFEGPDLLVHLRQDAAFELHRRTGGRADAVRGQLRTWRAQGLVRRGEAGLRVERSALDALRAEELLPAPPGAPAQTGSERFAGELLGVMALCWPDTRPQTWGEVLGWPGWAVEAALGALERRGEVVREGEHVIPRVAVELPWTPDRRRAALLTLARVLKPGSPGRLRHLLAAGRWSEVGEEAVARAARLEAEGRLGEAIGDLQAAWPVVEDPRPLLEPLVRVLLIRGRGPDREQALAYARQLGAGALARLVQASQDAEEGRGEQALAQAQALEPLEDPGLEMRRLAACLRAARNLPLEHQEALTLGLGEHPLVQKHRVYRAQWEGWMGHLRYRQRRFAEAAELHERAAEGEGRALTAQMTCWINAARSWLAAGQPERAQSLAARTRTLAEQTRHPALEAHALWVLRALANAAGETQPWLELPPALDRAELDPVVVGLGLINEAYIATRGRHPAAAALADQAAAAFARAQNTGGALHARALRAWLLGQPAADLVRQAQDPGVLRAHPEVALEVLALLSPGQLGTLDFRVRAQLEREALEAPERVVGVLTRAEAWVRLQEARTAAAYAPS